MQDSPTRRYRHYKGGEYEWLCEATYEPDPTIKMTVYRAANGTIWTRTSTMIHEMVEVDGVLYRAEDVDKIEAAKEALKERDAAANKNRSASSSTKSADKG